MSKSVSALRLHSSRGTTPEEEIPSCLRQEAFMTSLLMSAYTQRPTLMSFCILQSEKPLESSQKHSGSTELCAARLQLALTKC
ncbi:hypothetical protein EXN66_Car012044 [Channa argus]|uniref:Uncharacterized protein n=1 Tax=Channa argus TaxID=215402 RepID=A0A6G1Q1I3_CHAAH|nr:hypothetical protein EXN66_Car012044 [Channa argus]